MNHKEIRQHLTTSQRDMNDDLNEFEARLKKFRNDVNNWNRETKEKLTERVKGLVDAFKCFENVLEKHGIKQTDDPDDANPVYDDLFFAFADVLNTHPEGEWIWYYCVDRKYGKLAQHEINDYSPTGKSLKMENIDDLVNVIICDTLD